MDEFTEEARSLLEDSWSAYQSSPVDHFKRKERAAFEAGFRALYNAAVSEGGTGEHSGPSLGDPADVSPNDVGVHDDALSQPATGQGPSQEAIDAEEARGEAAQGADAP